MELLVLPPLWELDCVTERVANCDGLSEGVPEAVALAPWLAEAVALGDGPWLPVNVADCVAVMD